MRIFLRTPILKDVCERLLLKISASVTNLLKGGRDDDMHLKKGGGAHREFKKCFPPLLGDKENFKIYKL